MPKAGDSFTVTLKHTHVDWGDTSRKTNSRPKRRGENYIPIPRKVATQIGIYNFRGGVGIGNNEFNASTTDGILTNIVVKVGGSSKKGDKYAKNMHVSGNLKGFAPWFSANKVIPGRQVKVTWISSTDLTLELI